MKKIIILLIALTGIFTFKMENINRFNTPQLALFVFSFGILGSYLICRFNKYLGYLAGLCSLMFLKTMLFQQAPDIFLYEAGLAGFCIFGIYYFTRILNLQEDILKWFLIPAILNIFLVIIQVFDHNAIRILPVQGLSGFLGNPGVTGAFLGITTPLFIRYFRHGLWFLALALLLCGSTTGIIAGLLASAFYLYYTNKKYYNLVMLVICMLVTLVSITFLMSKWNYLMTEFWQRLIFWAGTLDGIKHNPILGWGVGSFEPIIATIPQAESYYLGGCFNYAGAIMNNPHNEWLLGWWQLGIGFPILVSMYLFDLHKYITENKALSFAIIVACLITSFTYFFSYPVWMIAMLSLAIYENGNSNKEALHV